MGLNDIHRLWAFVCVGLCSACCLYAVWRLVRGAPVDRPLWGLSMAGEVAFVVQGMLGAVLALQGAVPGKGWIHVLYGVVLVSMFPLAWLFSRGREPRAAVAAYAVISFFLVGVSVRAFMTGIP
jgi:hypothetical protein